MLKKLFFLFAIIFIGSAALAQNVGIGTTTPTTKLEVIGKTKTDTLHVTGNVGIGTATPINKLEVYKGSIKVSTIAAISWIAGNFGDTAANTNRVVMGYTNGAATIGAHNNALNAWANLAINTAGGNVGIGTATPTNKLEIIGKTKTDNLQIPTGAGTGKILQSDSSGNATWQKSLVDSLFYIDCGRLTGTVATGNNPYSVAVAGNYAYVVNRSSSTMNIYNVTNSTMPTLASTIATGNGPYSVAVTGNYAYVINNNSKTMTIYNVSNPAMPTLASTIATGNDPFSVAVAGNYAYVANRASNTITVYNVSNPTMPTLASTIATGNTPFSVAVAGNYAYVANFNSSTMTIYNVSNPTMPTLASTIATGNGAYSVAVAGNYAYVVNRFINTMNIYNVSNPTSPSLSATVNTNANPTSVAVAGNYAYVVCLGPSSSLQIFKINCNSSGTVVINPNGTAGTAPLTWATNDTSISNANTGNVGIGTTTPTEKLEVTGKTKTDNLYVTTNVGIGINNPNMTMMIRNNLTAPNSNIVSLGNGLGADPNFALDVRKGNVSDVMVQLGLQYGGSIPNSSIRFHRGGSNNDGFMSFTTNADVERMRIDASGNVGIGTITPTAQLDIVGTGIKASNNTSGWIAGNFGITTAATDRVVMGNISNAATIGAHNNTLTAWANLAINPSGGNVGIGTSAPTALLSVNGTADKPGGGFWGSFSDARVKQNVQNYTMGLKEILAIRPVSFEYNGKGMYKADGKKYIGIIAQEIEKVLPGTVTQIAAGGFTDLRKYDGSELTYTLINAIKEQQKLMEEMKKDNVKQLDDKQKQLDDKQKQIDALIKRLEILEKK